MKIYITKYALTKGIIEADISLPSARRYSGGLSVRISRGYSATYLTDKEWHKTREAAIARAEEMRTAKIASLRKQIAKLEQMKFDTGSDDAA